jgi:hypothetical protein
MSPEQAQGQDVGPLSDVFSLGAVLAFAATGRKPFGTGPPAAVLERVVGGTADLKGAPAGVRPLIERCLAKDPGGRPTAAELLAGVTAAQSAMEPRREPALRGGARRRSWRPLITASAVAGLLVASGAAGYGLMTSAQHQRDGSALSQTGAKMAVSPAAPAPRPAPPAPAPRITKTFTYQQGEMVFFELFYSDPGHNATGFGFVGVEGSDWPEQYHSFSNPAAGIVEANSISYPLNQGCGSGIEFTSTVRAWIYDSAGNRSKPVIIQLACTT